MIRLLLKMKRNTFPLSSNNDEELRNTLAGFIENNTMKFDAFALSKVIEYSLVVVI